MYSISGFDIGGRTQIVLDPGTIETTLLGHNLTHLAFRRDSQILRDLNAGQGTFTITLSPAGRSTLHLSEQFEQNLDSTLANRTVVFSGVVAIPASSNPVGRVVDWANLQDHIEFVFQTPYFYAGGGLCIDIVGDPVTGQEVGFWPVDGERTPARGSVSQVGAPCGLVNGTDAYISTGVSARSLVPGSTANFWARGPQGVTTALLFGGPMQPIDLEAFGLGAPGCTLDTDPFLSLITAYTNRPITFGGSTTATAAIPLLLPGVSGVVNTSLRAQFVNLTFPLQTSGAIDFTTANALPSSGIATVRSGADVNRGRVSTTWYPVIRFTTTP